MTQVQEKQRTVFIEDTLSAELQCIMMQKVFPAIDQLFVNLIGVLHYIQECFTCTSVGRILVWGKRRETEQVARRPSVYWKAFPRTAREESSINWNWNQGDRIGERFLGHT